MIAGSFWWYGSRTEGLVYAQSPNNAQYLVDAVMLKLHWLTQEKETDITLSSEKFIAETAKILQTHQEYQARLLIPGADKRENQPQTATEKEVLDYFIHEPRPSAATLAGPPEWRDQRQADKQEYHYFQAVRLRKECMNCHTLTSAHVVLGSAGLPAPPPPAPGDLLAVVEVIQPDAATQSALAKNRAIFITTALVTVFLAMMASYVIVRYVIVKPLKHLRNVSDEVSRGNIEARAEIHTADEFEELGVAFNRMLRHLVDVQDELRQVNTNLDTKVDELAQANMRLYELNRLKSDFLATMSHELRTPLNSIIGFSDVLGSIKSLDDKQKRYVQNIQKSGRVLLDMINDILDLAKIESGKMEMRLTEFRIDDVIAAQCDMARPLTERKNIDLEVEIEPNLPELLQDQGKVQQMLNNLLSNAIKFTPEGGRIVVSGAARRAARSRSTRADRGRHRRGHRRGRPVDDFREVPPRAKRPCPAATP